MNFLDIQNIFYNHNFDVKFMKPRDLLVYDDDAVIITNIEYCHRSKILFVYINLDCYV